MPEMLAEVGGQLPPGVDLPAVVEGGLPAWFGALAGQLSAGLDGEANATPEQMAQAFEGMAIARIAVLAGLGTVEMGADLRLDIAEPDRIQPVERGHRAARRADDQQAIAPSGERRAVTGAGGTVKHLHRVRFANIETRCFKRGQHTAARWPTP